LGNSQEVGVWRYIKNLVSCWLGIKVLVPRIQEMKKENTQKYIIKLSQVFLLGCFLFSIFFFSEKAEAATTQIFPEWNSSGQFLVDLDNYYSFSGAQLSGSCNYDFTITPPPFGTPANSVNPCSNGMTALTNSAFSPAGTFGNNPSGGDDGTWYIFFRTNSNNEIYYYTFTISGGEYVPAPPSNTATRVVLINPENNSTSTTSVTLEVEYYINSETHGDIEELNLEYYVYNPLLVSGTTGIKVEIEPIVFDELVSTSTTITLANNQIYTWQAKLNAGVSDPICAQGVITAVFCIFQNLQNKIIANSQTNGFTIGTDPRTSVTDFGNSLFDATGADSNLLGGGCAFVATSTCEITSPSTYGSCFTNSVIIAFCPSANTVSYATTTLMNSFYNKMPFGFFVQPYAKITQLANSTSTSLGTDVSVSIPQLGNSTTTIFSWSQAKDFMDGTIGEGVVTTLMIVEFVGLIFYLFYRLIGKTKETEI